MPTKHSRNTSRNGKKQQKNQTRKYKSPKNGSHTNRSNDGMESINRMRAEHMERDKSFGQQIQAIQDKANLVLIQIEADRMLR